MNCGLTLTYALRSLCLSASSFIAFLLMMGLIVRTCGRCFILVINILSLQRTELNNFQRSLLCNTTVTTLVPAVARESRASAAAHLDAAAAVAWVGRSRLRGGPAAGVGLRAGAAVVRALAVTDLTSRRLGLHEQGWRTEL